MDARDAAERGTISKIEEVHVMYRISKVAMLFLLLLFVGLSAPQFSAALETADFIVRDLTGQLSNEQISRLTTGAEDKLAKILAYYATDSGVKRLGKIRLEFDNPRGGATYSTVFLTVKDGNDKVRIVRVFGVKEEPEMVAHKLTHAVFPTGDKLVRNMMGIPMEVRFGNPLTFPMCGFTHDEWVMVFRRNNSYVPMSALGPDHEQWGMTTRDGVPVVLDKAKQHIMYAESGSFGAFLLNTYGPEKVKRFYNLSLGTERPWGQVFGSSLTELETEWLKSLDDGKKPDEARMSVLSKLVKNDPNQACTAAQELVGKKKSPPPDSRQMVPGGRRRIP
jgi:hypothetical protein